MSEKILIADLVAEVAELTSVPKNRCDDYVKAFFETIANALSVDGIVKVKGLGTFKLVSVEERKSVNVQTGAEMIIPAHSKVSFVPDKVLKDEINRPYAHLKTYVLNANAPLDPPEADDDEATMDDVDVAETQSTDTVAEVVAESAESVVEGAEQEVEEAPAPISEQVAEDSKQGETPIVEDDAKEAVTANADVDDKQEQSTTNSNDNSDWFDNWEVEYESTDKAEPAKSTEPSPKPASLSELLAKAEADRNERVEEVKPSATEAVSEPETEDSDEIVIPEDIKTPEQIVAEVMASVKGADFKAEQVAEEPVADSVEEVKEVAEEKVEEVVETVTEDVAEKADEVVETPTEPVAETAEQPIVNEQPAATLPTEEKVQHGKVLGIAIIAFLVLLAALIFGLLKVDPDFFKSLKAGSDNLTVVPADTSSLAQELSAYTEETENETDSTAAETDEQPEETIEETVKDQLSKPMPAEAVIDPLWDGEFVAYMKRQNPDVSLEIKGFNKEVAIKPGLFLTMVALDNYGDKSYWIYLYLYNKDRIKNPNNVPIGTKIRVPILDETLVNGTNEKNIEMAKEIRKVFVK